MKSLKAILLFTTTFLLTASFGYAQKAKIIEPEMIFVKGGTFIMGCTSEQGGNCWTNNPAHQVTVGDFYIGKYEVTQAQWKSVMGSNPSYFKGDNLPVERVGWNDVQKFIHKLNALTGKQYRLPTEAEWEFAARGGNKSKGYKYSGSDTVDDVAWYHGHSGRKTNIVGSKQSNELGLYDMSGNVWEWCSNWYCPYDSTAKANPKGPSSGRERVNRGGGWYSNAEDARVSYRDANTPNNCDYAIGFRLVYSSNK
ncbi:MAG: formylglycine-generating enzyme family protein [Dysgonamonadaceae bacterium]|jgi:formylglycine-generating enzyme required for sulfatase activity|nr:formylglycine-generating enzyme family protein [Dysgonamonadaceae bacterium]